MSQGLGDPVAWDLIEFTRALTTSVDSYDRPEAKRLCGLLVDELAAAGPCLAIHDAIIVLRQLRRKRFFELMQWVADALVRAGLDASCVRCEYAQALIELGLAGAAVDVLERAFRDAQHTKEVAEAQGLLGRAYKHMGMGTRNPARRLELLTRSVETYAKAFQDDPKQCAWHGINAAALLVMADRQGEPLAVTISAGDTARTILDTIEQRFADPYVTTGPWDAALAAEAQLVLARSDEAVHWIHRYAADPQADAFELSSTLRQMIDVWQLDSHTDPGSRILPILRGEILQRKAGERLELEAGEIVAEAATSSDALEKVLGSSGVVTHTWYRRGLMASRAVARISHPSGRPVGTGFLIDAEALTGRSGQSPLLVTNNHVIAASPEADDTLTPDQAEITFQVLAEEGNSHATFHVEEMVWSSPPDELDTTVLTLDAPVAGVEPCCGTPARPRRDGKQRVYVVGHPSGRELSYSIDDNVLLDYDDRVLHYRAPTEHGSSGSPVFNRDWEVIAVHHAGRIDMPRLGGQEGTYPANEGIWIEAVRRRLATE